MLSETQREQELVLGAVLVEQTLAPLVLQLTKSEDYCFPCRDVYDAIKYLYGNSELIDSISVSKVVAEHSKVAMPRSFVMELAANAFSSASEPSVEYHSKQIQNQSLLDKLQLAGEQIQYISQNKRDSLEAISEAQGLILDITDSRVGSDSLYTGAESAASVIERAETLMKNPDKAVGRHTGFVAIDKLTNGWQDSDLIVIGGRPSMGKTAFVLNTSLATLKNDNLPVVMFSLEMSHSQLTSRMMSCVSGVEANAIRTGRLTNDELSRLKSAQTTISEWPLYIEDCPSLNPVQARLAANRVMMETSSKLGLVVIDYLQLMESDRTGSPIDNRVQVVSHISRSMKNLARELDCPVILLSQLSRAVEARDNKRPQLSDLRESGSIEQDADIVAFLYRDEYYNPNTNTPGMAEFIISKQRNGPVGTVELSWDNTHTRFRSIPNFQGVPTSA